MKGFDWTLCKAQDAAMYYYIIENNDNSKAVILDWGELDEAGEKALIEEFISGNIYRNGIADGWMNIKDLYKGNNLYGREVLA